MCTDWQRLWALAVLAIVSASFVGCRGQVRGGSSAAIEDVLLITVDTARADRFSYTGVSPVETPEIDRLAAEGVAFLQALSPVPITLAAHSSIFTGQWPPTHGVRNNGTYRLREGAQTLSETLREQGFSTAAFVGGAVLDRRYGLEQGFDHYDDRFDPRGLRPERRAEEVVSQALEWLDRQPGDKTFVWVHLFDPHDPYDPPEPERSQYADSLYNGEIAYVDRVVGDLVHGYKTLGRYRRSLIALTSDHGESLGAHGEPTHGIFVHDTTMLVPLVLRGPGLPEGQRIEDQVRLIDLYPTICVLLGISVPAGVEGRDLSRLVLDGNQDDELPAYLETLLPFETYGWAPQRGLRLGGLKLIEGSGVELFDLGADPGESTNLAGSEPTKVTGMQGRLAGLFGAMRRTATERIELDEDSRRQLAALGYLSGIGPAVDKEADLFDAQSQSLPDPRHRVHLIRDRSIGAELFNRGFRQQGVDKLKWVLEQDPSNVFVTRSLVQLLMGAGRGQEAAELLGRHLGRLPGDGRGLQLRGRLAENRGDPEVAIDAYHAAQESGVPMDGLREHRWELMLAAGRQDDLRLEAAAIRAKDRTDRVAVAFEAIARWGWEDPRLEAVLMEESHGAPDSAELLVLLGDLHARRGDHLTALPVLSRAQMQRSRSVRFGVKLARTLMALDRPADVLHVLGYLRPAHALDVEAWQLLAEACLDLENRPCVVRAVRQVEALAGDAEERHLLAEQRQSWKGWLESQASPAAIDSELAQAAKLLKGGHAREASVLLQPLYNRFGPDLEVGALQAEVLALLSDWDSAREVLTRAAESSRSLPDPSTDPTAADLRTAETLSRVGTLAWSRRLFWEALQAYQLGAFLVPDDPRFHYNVGLAWEKIGGLSEANAAFSKVVEIDPDFAKARSHLEALSTKLARRST